MVNINTAILPLLLERLTLLKSRLDCVLTSYRRQAATAAEVEKAVEQTILAHRPTKTSSPAEKAAAEIGRFPSGKQRSSETPHRHTSPSPEDSLSSEEPEVVRCVLPTATEFVDLIRFFFVVVGEKRARHFLLRQSVGLQFI